jgi:hypothetical protein
MRSGHDLRIALVCALLLVAAAACGTQGSLGSLQEVRNRARPETAQLDATTVVAGLKEALRVGTETTVQRTSRLDGYLGNDLIRIRPPESLNSMVGAVRAVGLGSQVDQFEVAMNRSAERAAGETGDVFVDAIRSMSIADARGILEGGDTAATEYFRKATWEPLRLRVHPIVSEKMDEVGVVRIYDSLAARYSALPFTTAPAVDLRSYVTDRALDGLFVVLAGEERRIRTDPSARVTELLQQVFGP